MFLGQTLNVEAYLDRLGKVSEYGTRDYLFFLVFLVFMIVGIVGIFKLFKALHYILKNNFSYHPYVVWFFTVLFFAVQLYYARGFI
jgi:succinate dehydrogenase/fumarate reductase cytochrome b subunit